MSTITNYTALDGWYLAEDKVLVYNVVTADGSVQVISGLTIEFVLSATQGGAALSGFPITADITDGPGGITTVVVPSAATSTLTAGTYWYTLWITDSSSRTELSGGTADLLAPQTVTPF